MKLLLFCEKHFPGARQWAAEAGQERRGTFGGFCENPRESGLVEGQKAAKETPGKITGGTTWGAQRVPGSTRREGFRSCESFSHCHRSLTYTA